MQSGFFERFNIFTHLLELNGKYYQFSFAFCVDGLSTE